MKKAVTRQVGFLLLAAIAITTAPLAAQTVTVTPTISGNELTARIELPGGFAADLAITFEQVVGLNPTALAITASVVNPNDLALLGRLPSQVTIPAGFPVMVRIEPGASSALSFSGVTRVSLHTHNLTFTAGSPLRLYKSPTGGAFKDMTGLLEMGSVRAGGSSPGFSDFLIASDARAIAGVIAEKLAVLEQTLTANATLMSPAAYGALTSQMTQIHSLVTGGSTASAIDALVAFGAEVKKRSGAEIPDVWQANSSAVVNVAGLLRTAADTLRFTLVMKANG